MWLWNFLKKRLTRAPRCRRCGMRMEPFQSSSMIVYICPLRELHPKPWQKAQTAKVEQTTDPLRLFRPSKPGVLLQYYRLMRPSEVDTQQTQAIRLKNYSPKRVR